MRTRGGSSLHIHQPAAQLLKETHFACMLAPACHFLASQDSGKDLRVRAVRLIIDGCESGFAGGQKLRPAWQWEGCVMCVRGGEGRAFN